MKIRNAIVGASLWVVATGVWALSLGGSRGAVVLGAPLDLSFDVQPDPGTDIASACITARIMAGETTIGDGRVRVTLLPDMRGQPPAVRVQATIAVDEPVVTVTLSAGCTGKVTRTYTFLTELPIAAPRSGAPVDISQLPAVERAGVEPRREGQASASARGAGSAAVPGAPSAPLAAAPSSPPAPASPPMASVAPPPPAALPRAPGATRPAERSSRARAQAAASAPRAAKKAPPAPAPVDRPRLVVEALDLWTDSPVVLRSSPELSSVPSDQPSPERAQAAAMWQALNAPPEAPAAQADRLSALETEVAALRAKAASDSARAAQLQQQLEQVQNDRFPATVVYALAAAVLLALLLVLWGWVRLRSASERAVRAWRDSVAALGGEDVMAEHGAALGLAPQPSDHWVASDELSGPRAPSPDSAAAPLAPVFVATAPLPSAPAPLKATPEPPAAVATQAPLHIVSPEELFDMQQQAEFFVSVGEHQQAIEVLKKHIAERGATSPLAYLELLRLYHTLSRVDEFSQLRMQFMQSFNAQVPEFSGFHRTGRMLYHYTDALAEIEEAWTSPGVVMLLEKLLFKPDGVESQEPFDLAAYDDLLLLLAIAQTTPPSARGAPAPRKRTTPLAPPRDDTQVLRQQSRPTPATAVSAVAAAPGPAAPADSLSAGLDFDFDAHLPAAVDLAPQGQAATAPSSLQDESRGAPLELDLDLSEPPHLTLSDLPPAPVTPPPAQGQPVGFGMDNDLMELRLELEKKRPGN